MTQMPSRADLQTRMKEAEEKRLQKVREHSTAVIEYFIKLVEMKASENQSRVSKDVTGLPWACYFKTEEILELLKPEFPDCNVTGMSWYITISWD